MTENENEVPLQNAPPPPLVQPNPTAVGGGGRARDMDGGGADNAGDMVGGGSGADAPFVVVPLQQQFVAPSRSPLNNNSSFKEFSRVSSISGWPRSGWFAPSWFWHWVFPFKLDC